MDPDLLVLIVMIAIFILFLIVTGFVLVRLNKIKRTQDKLLSLFGNDESVDKVLTFAEDFWESKQNIARLQRDLVQLREKQKSCFDRVNIVRYNAAGESEAKMSYSVGISNDNEDGLIITGLHYRTGVNMYFKEVCDGVGDYPLSKEEKEAVSRSKVSKVRK